MSKPTGELVGFAYGEDLEGVALRSLGYRLPAPLQAAAAPGRRRGPAPPGRHIPTKRSSRDRDAAAVARRPCAGAAGATLAGRGAAVRRQHAVGPRSSPPPAGAERRRLVAVAAVGG